MKAMSSLLAVNDGKLVLFPVTERKLARWFRQRNKKRLLAALKNEELEVNLRAMAAFAVGKLKAREAIPVLTDLLEQAPTYLRRNAIIALGLIGDPSALGALDQTIRSEDQVLSKKAIESIGYLVGDENNQILKKLLAAADSTVREAALVAVSRSSLSDRTRILVDGLTDPARHVRGAAANCLSRVRDPESIPDLLESFAFEGWKNYAVFEALEKFSTQEMSPHLDRYRKLRLQEADALRQMGR